MGSNPLRAPPRPFIKREIKREQRPRKIPPPAPKREPDNPEDYNVFTLNACTEKDIEDVRTHVLKFQSKNKVDPTTDFTKPIRLHRKETRNLQYQLTRAEIEQRQRERLEAARLAEEEAQRAAEEAEANGEIRPAKIDISKDPNVAPEPVKTEEEKKYERQLKQQAQIAPDGGARRKLNKQQIQKTKRVKVTNEADKKLRYEEYYPWVMEDYDGKNTYVGAYEAANSDTYFLLVASKDEGFKMIPADKVYKFTPRNKYATLTLEEAEARMEKNNTVPRWLMKHLDENEQKLTRYERTQKKLKTVEGTSSNDKGGRDSDNDDLDFDEEFADDEEAPIIDGDEEENRESERRIKREMLTANAMGLKEDGEADEDVDDLFETRKVDKEGERVRKALMKTDMSGMYDSDKEENPYLSESDLDIDKSDEEIIAADLSKPVSPTGSRQGSPPTSIKQIKIKSVNRPVGMVVFKALPSLLMKFPRGEWNPNAKKRVVEFSDNDERDTKRVKLENSRASSPQVKEENTTTIIPDDDTDLLTEEDVLKAVTEETNITAKELIHKLKNKLKNPANKERIKVFVKKLLKNNDGFLVPK